MSLHEYIISQEIAKQDYPFYALIFAAMRQADSINIERLKAQWPAEYLEMQERYNAPGGALDEDELKQVERWRDASR